MVRAAFHGDEARTRKVVRAFHEQGDAPVDPDLSHDLPCSVVVQQRGAEDEGADRSHDVLLLRVAPRAATGV